MKEGRFDAAFYLMAKDAPDFNGFGYMEAIGDEHRYGVGDYGAVTECFWYLPVTLTCPW